eukprot:1152454-Pelagomonas_calceolata.AAC.1
MFQHGTFLGSTTTEAVLSYIGAGGRKLHRPRICAVLVFKDQVRRVGEEGKGSELQVHEVQTGSSVAFALVLVRLQRAYLAPRSAAAKRASAKLRGCRSLGISSPTAFSYIHSLHLLLGGMAP